MKKGKRKTNYTSEENLLLMNIVAKHKNKIECKKTNALTWAEKNAAWDRITEEFNSQTPHGVLREKKCYCYQ
jgi:hypothetical protein